jgi:hypothetical protein
MKLYYINVVKNDPAKQGIATTAPMKPYVSRFLMVHLVGLAHATDRNCM